MRHAVSAPNFYAGASTSTLFVPPPQAPAAGADAYGYAAPPYDYGDQQQSQQSQQGLWGEAAVYPHAPGVHSSSAIACDPHQDLVWSGTRHGHVSAHGPALQTHCAFWAEAGAEVRQLLPADGFVVSLCHNSLRIHGRTGVPRARFTAPEKTGDLLAAAFAAPGQLALGGVAPSLFMYDVETNRLSLQVGLKAGCTELHAHRNALYGGQTDGNVAAMDPRSFRSTATFFSGFGAGVQALDVKDKLLCCSGYTLDRVGNPYLDGVVRLFDLRMMRALAPVGFAPGAFALAFHPVFSGTMVLMAQTGQLQVCDAQGSHGNLQTYAVNAQGALLTDMSVASSGEVVGMCDSSGFLHQWADRDGAMLNLYPRALEEPTPERIGGAIVLPDDERVPGAHKDLLSTWPSDMWFQHPQPTPPMPAVYISNAQPAREGDFIMYAQLPAGVGPRRYLCPWAEPVRYVDMSIVDEQEDARDPPPSPLRGPTVQAASVPESPSVVATTTKDASLTAAVLKPPGIYQEKTISYSRLGVSGFDFTQYNRTPFSGLENTLPNSYINAALQMLYFLPPVRRALQAHRCARDFCFSCELAFLFQMLERSQGTVCQASNLLRVLAHVPLAKELRLVALDDASFTEQSAGIGLVERFVTFSLRQLQAERNAGDADVLSALLRLEQTLVHKCKRCGATGQRETNMTDVVPLEYPRDTSTKLTFGALLHASLVRRWTGPRPDSDEWCAGCGNKQPSSVFAMPHSFPPHMLVTAGLGSLGIEQRAMWKSATHTPAASLDSDADDAGLFRDAATVRAAASWVPSQVKISVDATTGALQVEELANEAVAVPTPGTAVYCLSALLCHVHDPRKFPGPGHSVLHQKIDAAHTTDKTARSWYLFNDFQVVKTSAREALSFDTQFKNAVALVLTRVMPPVDVGTEPAPPAVSASAFFAPPLVRAKAPTTYALNTEDDLPRPGELLPIDAEFVSLAPEEHKVLANGSSVLVRPMHLSLARLSILREDGRVLVDDYIQACDPIDDYLTRFSGIQPGDLDVDHTSHSLVKLKMVYLKLLWLVDRGCVFVGHGLSKDFRILNIWVPPAQIYDTVELFHLPRSRKISLRFLASYLLDREIQTDTHDSIEDAQTAMAVYRKYREMVNQGNFDDALQRLYDTGRASSWMVSQLGGVDAPSGDL